MYEYVIDINNRSPVKILIGKVAIVSALAFKYLLVYIVKICTIR